MSKLFFLVSLVGVGILLATFGGLNVTGVDTALLATAPEIVLPLSEAVLTEQTIGGAGAVAEPETVAMMLFGLACIGVASVRRRRLFDTHF